MTLAPGDAAFASARRGRVAIMTRMQTENAGNEALSSVLIRHIAEAASECEVRAFDRWPRVMTRFDFASVAAGEDAITRFEALVDALEARTRAAAKRPGADVLLADAAADCNVRIVERPRLRSSLVATLKRRFHLRSRLAAAGLLRRDEARRTFNTISWCDLLIWNPAGEFHPTGSLDEGIRLLLLVRLAQRLGKRTAIVNHSLEATDPTLNTLIAHVYNGADFVSVRESGSYRRGLDMGLAEDRLHEIPDLVFLTLKHPPTAAYGSVSPYAGHIVLSLNGLEAHRGGRQWDTLFAGLKAFGRPITFLSNSMNDDIPFARAHAGALDAEVVSFQPGYVELARAYRDAAVVISSRLHAAILALSADTPVVSIEPQLFKLTAIFEQLGYPVATQSMSDPDWARSVLDKTATVLERRDEIVQASKPGLVRQVATIEEGYRPLIELARAASTTASRRK